MNTWVGVGRLVANPEVRATESGKKIARYKLAVDRRFKREGEPTADFIPCIAFGTSAEFAEKYFTKGMRVGVTGRIQTGSYKNKDGVTIYTTDVIVESQEFCESKKESTENNASSTDDFMAIPEGMDEELPFI